MVPRSSGGCLKREEGEVFHRLRIWLAKLLVKGTRCGVVRRTPLLAVELEAKSLAAYVKDSGGLQDPKRVRAYRKVFGSAVFIATEADKLSAE